MTEKELKHKLNEQVKRLRNRIGEGFDIPIVGGGIGVIEIFKFFNRATVPEINLVQKLINNEKYKEAKRIIDKVLARGKKP